MSIFSRVKERTGTVTRIDVRNSYYLFLGRYPENDEVFSQKINLSRNDLLKKLLLSKEFSAFDKDGLSQVVRHSVPVEAGILHWAAHALPISTGTAFDLATCQTWDRLLKALFDDSVFLASLGRDRLKLNALFLACLAAPEPAAERRSVPKVVVGSFDQLSAGVASGWIRDPENLDEIAEVEFRVDGEVIATHKASFMRPDVRDAGLSTTASGFSCPLPPTCADGAQVSAFLKGTSFELLNSPQTHRTPGPLKYLLERRERIDGLTRIRLMERQAARAETVTVSLVMPVYNTRADWLIESIDSVRNQLCPNWELICIDDASTEKSVATILAHYARLDPRIKHLSNGTNKGISHSCNLGIDRAGGDYVAFLDHDDYLEPNAIGELIEAARDGADLIYSDELLTTEDIDQPLSVAARPAFSHDYYLCHPYFVHLICVRKSVAAATGGWDTEMTISADVDFVLKALEHSRSVTHIPKVLYRWRTHQGSTGHARQDLVMRSTAKALNGHLARLGLAAEASPNPSFNVYTIRHADAPERALIVIPTKNGVEFLEPCIESIRETVDPSNFEICVIDHQSDDPATRSYLESIRSEIRIFNWSGPFNYGGMHNAAVQWLGADAPELLLLMNNDIEAIAKGWFEEMRSLALREDVGAVGATLLYPDDTIQHSGVILGIDGTAEHAFKFEPYRAGSDALNVGYGQSLICTREYSAVTAACMMTKRSLFERVGGFDERLAVGFNDTDLCLRIGALGKKIVNTPNAVLYHRESATRIKDKQVKHPGDTARFKEKWKDLLREGDAFYNPQLTLRGRTHFLADEMRFGVANRTRPGLRR